jgi:hypothetical protein
MKSCPLCHRTYPNDEFAFCLADGALLSAPYDPKQTLVIPKLNTELPPTLISPLNSKLDDATTEKEIAAPKPAGKRRRWNESSFFKDAAKNLTTGEVEKVRRLYEFSVEYTDRVKWGTGPQRGAFSAVCYSLDLSKSLYTAFSDGTLGLNFGWLPKATRTEVIINNFAQSLKKLEGFDIPSDFRRRFINVYKEDWISQFSGFTRAVREVAVASRDADL